MILINLFAAVLCSYVVGIDMGKDTVSGWTIFTAAAAMLNTIIIAGKLT